MEKDWLKIGDNVITLEDLPYLIEKKRKNMAVLKAIKIPNQGKRIILKNHFIVVIDLLNNIYDGIKVMY